MSIRLTWLLVFMIDAALVALNVAVYVADPNPWSAGAAVFIGLLALWALWMSASEDT